MKHIVVLASGNGGNLKFFNLAAKSGLIKKIRLSVVADRECGSVHFAKRNGIEGHIVNYTRTDPFEFNGVLSELQPDLIITNWHKIIDAKTVRAYQGKLVNLHYSLLPAFGGLIGVEPIKKAYAQGCKFIGPTCHLVDEGVDTGRILAQAVFKTDIPLDEAVPIMFRKGCLTLLSGVQQVIGEQLWQGDPAQGEDSYAPPLGFRENLFNEEFWKELAQA